MLYRNKRTGAVIETDCNISGGDWADVMSGPESSDEAAEDASEAKPKRKGRVST